MRVKIDALGGLLKRIGNFDPASFESDFNDRLILQKTVYLMEKFGLHIGYYFSWYLRGPYSPSLARDAYALAKTYSEIKPVRFANPAKENRFCEFLAFIKPFSSSERDLERIASIHFLCKAYPDTQSKEIYFKIKGKIPSITITEFEETKTLLKENGLLEA
jgi:uncharacterized protein YwgA